MKGGSTEGRNPQKLAKIVILILKNTKGITKIVSLHKGVTRNEDVLKIIT